MCWDAERSTKNQTPLELNRFAWLAQSQIHSLRAVSKVGAAGTMDGANQLHASQYSPTRFFKVLVALGMIP